MTLEELTHGLDGAGERELVAELTRELLAEVAPEESAVFADHEAAYLEGQAAPSGLSDDSLGFGGILLTPLIPVLVQVAKVVVRHLVKTLAEVADEESKPLVTSWVRRLLRQQSADGATGSGRDRGTATAGPPVRPELLSQIRAATLEVCGQMHTSPEDSELIADAVVGRLVCGLPSVPS